MDANNSSFLDLIIEKAKKISDKSNALTYESFFAALLEYIDNSGETLQNNDEAERTLKLLDSHLNADRQILTRNLKIYISKSTGSFMDNLAMQSRMRQIQEKAKKEQLSVIPVDYVVELLLKDPTDNFRGFLSNIQGLSSSEANPQPVQTATDTVDLTETITPAPSTQATSDTISQIVTRVKQVQNTLLSKVFGQDNAISVFSTGYFQAELLALTERDRFRPAATYLFAGPPGVGKTFLAENIAAALQLPFKRFDMSEYADKEANLEFCGTDKVYKDAKAGNVTSFVAANPKCVLLFDEIEKAHSVVTNLFLQILDAGRIRDNFTDNEVAFKDAIIIFTTNAGKQLYTDSESGDLSCLSRKVILKALSKDTNPATGVPFFPGALCSRFASGNVVMFNHISAHDLTTIARRTYMQHVDCFVRNTGLQLDIDDKIFTALLLSEGGSADARTVRARAELLFTGELYELYRLAVSRSDVELKKISVRVELPKGNDEILSLFTNVDKPDILVFSSEEAAATCKNSTANCTFHYASNIDDAMSIIKQHEIELILIDPSYGKYGNEKYLNLEDIESKSRDFFWKLKDGLISIPIYLLFTPQFKINDEEKMSFRKLGIRGFIELTADNLNTQLFDICERLHQQKSLDLLTSSNKLVSFETAQLLDTDNCCAEIRLFDFELTTAIDAEDSKNILSNLSRPNVKFEQVIGADDAKKELQYFVEYMKNPKRYMGTGVRAPRGLLLYGPPGTGKTMLAKAMAAESGVTFIAAEGNQFLKKYIGEGEETVHELFRTARKYAPSILFIDEIDAIAKERTGGELGRASESVLTAFLAEMDGFKTSSSKPVFVLAATNFEVEPGGDKSLDPALVRRFDRSVYIDLPKKEDRITYIKKKMESLQALQLSEGTISNIAMRSTGMSLANLESVIELALRLAIRKSSDVVTDEVFEEAFETYNSGDAKKWDEATLERVARHESGHAFVCWQSGEKPSYLTIVARGSHGGYMQHGDNENKQIYTREELLSLIRTSLAGRAAELVYYGNELGMSTGASSDIASATNTAQHLVCTYGMDDDFGLAAVSPRAYQDGEMSSPVRAAVNRILINELAKAIELIKSNKDKVDSLVNELLKNDSLNGEEIESILS